MKSPNRHNYAAIAACAGAVLLLFALTAHAHDPRERERVVSRHDFQETLRVLQQAVKENKMGLVTRASAQAGAKSIGVAIPGNQVWGLFRPPFAVRMLRASVVAGIEAPVRLYITEGREGRVTVSYIKPTRLFAPYGNSDLDAMARELDIIFQSIAASVR